MVLRMVGDVENAKDITQDIFVKTYEKLRTFNFKHRFFSWFYRIALNETLSWLKRYHSTERLQEVQYAIADETTQEDPERMNTLLHSGLMELPEDYRSLLILKYYSQLSYEELSEISGVSLKKVKSRLFIAREQLRKVLLQKGFPGDE